MVNCILTGQGVGLSGREPRLFMAYQRQPGMRDLEPYRSDYLYWDLEEVARAAAGPIPVTRPGDEAASLALERWASLVRQGAFFKAVGRVNWRVVPEAPRLAPTMLSRIQELGELVDAFLAGLERQLAGSPFLRAELGFPPCAQEETIWEVERYRAVEMLRLDLALENGGNPKLLEIQVVMGGLGITVALRRAYGPHPCLPGILPLYEAALERVRGSLPEPGSRLAAVLGARRSAYRHEHLLLARSLEAWRLVVAPLWTLSQTREGALALPDGREISLIHRLFRSPGIFQRRDGKASMMMGALSRDKVRFLNPWKDVLEDKRVLALVHHPQALEHLGGALDSGQLERLRAYVPPTWKATPGVISSMLGLPASKRDLYLKKGRSFESRALFHGRQLSLKQWEAACLRAKLEGDWVVQREVHAEPWSWNYLDPCSGRMRSMRGYVRLCPFFFRDSAGHLRLADLLITAREEASRVHGASDAVLVVAGPTA